MCCCLPLIYLPVLSAQHRMPEGLTMLVMLGIEDSAHGSYAFGISFSMKSSLLQQCTQAKIWMHSGSKVYMQAGFFMWSTKFANLVVPACRSYAARALRPSWQPQEPNSRRICGGAGEVQMSGIN